MTPEDRIYFVLFLVCLCCALGVCGWIADWFENNMHRPSVRKLDRWFRKTIF